jgi:hypothetical protein
MNACDELPRTQHRQPHAQTCRRQRASPTVAHQVTERNDVRLWSCSSLAGAAMNRFVHRIVMAVLLVAALVLIWNVLGAR